MIFRLVFSSVLFTLLMGCGRTKEEKVTDSGSQSKPNEANLPQKKTEIASVPEKTTKMQEVQNGSKNVVSGESFKHGELAITIIDVFHESSILGLNFGSEKFLPSTPVWIKFENTSKTKILDTPGWHGKASLQDEHENKFSPISLTHWRFYEERQIQDSGERINPLTTTIRSLYFEGIPKTSKSFVLTLPLDGQLIRCKGMLGENTKRMSENEEKESEKLRVEKNKMEEKKRIQNQEAMDKKEIELKQMEEKNRLETFAKEVARKKELEDKGLPYYPLPKTTVKIMQYGRRLPDSVDAEQAYKIILESKNPSTIKEALVALKDLKDEGVPFLLDLLLREPTTQGREIILVNLYSGNIHANDTYKIVDLLNKNKNQISTRIAALNLLAKGGNAKPFLEKIKVSTADLLLNKNVKEEVKGYIEKISR
jgi:hypothetical protein